MCEKHEKIDFGFSIDNYPEGTHMCLIYSSEEERVKIIGKFLENGLKSGFKVAYFTDGTSPEEVCDWLRNKGIQLPETEEKSQLNITSTKSAYFPNGKFVPEETLDTLKKFYTNARKEQYSAVRISGEMTWALNGIPGSERLMEYESKVNEVVMDYPMTAICQYDATKFNGATLLECLKVHPFMIVHGQIVKNPYYMKTGDYLKTLAL